MVIRSFSDHLKQGWIGRQLPRRLQEGGLTDVSVTHRMLSLPFPFFALFLEGHLARLAGSGILSRRVLDAWSAPLAEAHAEGRFVAGITAFIVAGSRSG